MHGFYTHSNISYSVFINYVDIYKSVTNYKNNSQMFEIVFHTKLSVSFLFFSNSGTTCCLHCSSETKIPVILFNESSFVKYQETWVFIKGKVWSILHLIYQTKWTKVTVVIWSVIESSLLYLKLSEKSWIV